MKPKTNFFLVILTIFLIILILFIQRKTTKGCEDYNNSDCPTGCAVCPPCVECNSLKCQKASYCDKMGFDEKWRKEIKQ